MGISKANVQNPKEAAVTPSEEVFVPEEPKYSLDDIILPQSVRDQILDVTTYVDNSHLVFEIWGFKRTHKFSKRIGINLYGAPGTGKTMAAHAIAKQLGRKILIVNYADVESKYVGETPKNLRKVFETGAATNSIIFFDEADAILSRRVTNMTQAVDVSVNQTRSVMLMLMNGYQDFIIFASNAFENLPCFHAQSSMHVRLEVPGLGCRCRLGVCMPPGECPSDVNAGRLTEKDGGGAKRHRQCMQKCAA